MSLISISLKTKLVQSKLSYRYMLTSIIHDTNNPFKKSEDTNEKVTLQALLRSPKITGKKLKSRNKLTGEDWIPGNLYGAVARDGTCIAMSKRDFQNFIQTYGVSTENTLVELTVFDQCIDTISKDPIVVDFNGKSRVAKVVPRQVDYDPLTDVPRGVNFVFYKPGQTKLRIPIKYINEEDCADYKNGGYRVDVNQFLECICSSDDIPAFISVDMSDKKIGDVIKLKDMILPRHVRPSYNVDATQFVASIVKSDIN